MASSREINSKLTVIFLPNLEKYPQMWDLILHRIHYYFNDSQIFILYQICKSWTKFLKRLDKVIYTRFCKEFGIQIERLPSSFHCWRHYFYTKRRMHVGKFDYYVCRSMLKIPRGTWSDVQKRMPGYHKFSQLGYPKNFKRIPHQHRRYIGCISTSKCVYWEGNWLWYASGKHIMCINLKNNKITDILKDHFFPITSLKGNGNGIMVTVDQEKFHRFWRLSHGKAHLMYKKAFLNGPVHIQLFRDEILCMNDVGVVLIWDINTGIMISQISLPEADYLYQYRFERTRDYLYSLNRETGNVELYQVLPSKKFSLLSKRFEQCGVISPSEYSFAHFPEFIRAYDDCIVSCSHGEIYIWRLPVQSDFMDTFKFEYYYGTHTMVDMDFTFPVRPMRGPVILTEWESTKPFGFETASSYPNFRECTMDVDESVLMLYCTDSNHDPTLSVWDFRVDRKYDRYYERIQVGNQQCFVCYEDILETS